MKFRLITLFSLLLSLPAISLAGTTWETVKQAMEPRIAFPAYNPITDEVIIRGGNQSSDCDTWLLQGDSWEFACIDSITDCQLKSTPVFIESLSTFICIIPSLTSLYQWQDNNWVEFQDVPLVVTNRTYIKATYDVNRDVVVIFGGYGSGQYRDDTWEWDGLSWTKMNPAHKPIAQSGHGIVYDSLNERVILVGEDKDTAPPWIATFWTWDGTDWTEHDPTTQMGSRENAGIAYDTCRDRVVVFGGYGYSTPTSTRGGLTDTWEYYDDDWHFVETDHAPPPRSEIGMTFDSNRCRCVMFGGLGSTLRSDTWAYDGTDWTEIGLNQGFPTGDNRYATAYDSHRNRLVLFGGYDETFMSFSVSDLWEWDGENWLFRYDENNPSARADSGFAYDPVRQECVLYGGYNKVSIKSDTWTWDGNEWTEKQPAHCPGPRFDMEMIYDAGRDRIVLFGGIKDGGYVSNLVSDQTWEWDGTDWIQRDVSVHPPPCVEYGFAYDSHRKRCVLFGGLAKADPDNWHQSFFYQPDTWEWDGVQWLLIPTDYDPAWSHCDRMAYDSHRRRCVMFKNSTLETWEWDGADWHLMHPSGEELPETMYGSGIEYDSERREIILHNGDMFDLRVYKTWAYHHTDPDICTDLGLTLTMPLTYYTPGDTFYCDASICNNTGEILNGYPLFILLDVYGDYFWGPGWTQDFDGYWDELPVLDEGVTDYTVIPEFTWPEGAGTASGIAFVGCVTDPEIRIPYGNVAYVEFGWN